QQDMVGNADLADVVQRRGELDGLRLVVLEAERPGDQARIARHADQMVAGLLVAKFTRPRKPQQRFLFALAHFLGRVLHHVLEQAPPVLERERLTAQRQQIPAARKALARCRKLRTLRSEEHTSELQSRENLVCRLLPEQNKNTTTREHATAS